MNFCGRKKSINIWSWCPTMVSRSTTGFDRYSLSMYLELVAVSDLDVVEAKSSFLIIRRRRWKYLTCSPLIATHLFAYWNHFFIFQRWCYQCRWTHDSCDNGNLWFSSQTRVRWSFVYLGNIGLVEILCQRSFVSGHAESACSFMETSYQPVQRGDWKTKIIMNRYDLHRSRWQLGKARPVMRMTEIYASTQRVGVRPHRELKFSQKYAIRRIPVISSINPHPNLPVRIYEPPHWWSKAAKSYNSDLDVFFSLHPLPPHWALKSWLWFLSSSSVPSVFRSVRHLAFFF